MVDEGLADVSMGGMRARRLTLEEFRKGGKRLLGLFGI